MSSNYNKEKKAEYSDELAKLQSDPEHYMTPGARRYFRRVTFGYLILAVATCIGIWGVGNRFDNQLRNQINTFIVANCKSSIPTLTNFNAGLDADIEIQKDALALNLSRGDIQRAMINRKAIQAKKNSKLHVPTLEECNNKKAF